jgi:hypothetical protein
MESMLLVWGESARARPLEFKIKKQDANTITRIK